jgi:hypothetical protein
MENGVIVVSSGQSDSCSGRKVGPDFSYGYRGRRVGPDAPCWAGPCAFACCTPAAVLNPAVLRCAALCCAVLCCSDDASTSLLEVIR